MKLYFIFTVCLVGTSFGNSLAQKQQVTLNLKNVSLYELFNQIKEQTGLRFLYNAEQLDGLANVSVQAQNEKVSDVLNKVFSGKALTYDCDGKVIIVKKQEILPQTIKAKIISGKVTDYRDNPLPGVTIQIKGTAVGTSTNSSGVYSLPIATSDAVLIFSFIGMKTQEIAVANKSEINVKMTEESSNLDEVVVTGYQDIRRDRVTGSVTVITAKEIENNSFKSIDQILEGKVAGLYSYTTSGAPGTRANIRIRGDNSISGNKEPLWVVDGLPLQGGVASINVVNAGNIQESILDHGIGNIAPTDIESITVLKDAAASAIYGARAANGVIVIKTKRGFEGKATFNYNGSFGMVEAPRIDLDFMNSSEKIDFEISLMKDFSRAWEGGLVGKIYDYYMQGRYTESQYREELDKLRKINTDWFDVIFRKAFSQSHFLSMRGGTEKTNYYASINYNGQSGILKSNSYDNLGASLEIRHKPAQNFEMNFKLNGNFRESKDHNSSIDPFKYAVFANPYEKPFNEDGSYAADFTYLGDNRSSIHYGNIYDQFNILRELNETQNKTIASDLSARLGMNYQVMEGLSVDLNGSLTYSTNNTEAWAAPGTYTSYSSCFASSAISGELPEKYNNGYLREGSGRSTAFAFRGLISYNNDKLENHAFSVVVGTELAGSKSYNNYHRSPEFNDYYRFIAFPDFPSDDISYNDIKNSLSGLIGTAEAQDRSASFFGALTYTLCDKYVFNLNARFDGADIIGTDNRFTPLWSASFRWNAMRENFLKDVNFISDLAIRLSYGYTGNIDRSSYPIPMIFLSGYRYDENFVAESVTFPNPNIKWERKQDRNFGLDFGFWDNRIGGSFNYYWNTGKDLLGTMTTPESYGRTSIKANASSIENTRWEFNVNLRLDLGANVRWINSFNIAQNTNKIKKTYLKDLNELNVMGGSDNIEGYASGSMFGYRFAGVNPLTGQAMIYLTDESRKILADYRGVDISQVADKIDTEEIDYNIREELLRASMEKLGSVTPKVTGGFSSTLTWKKLEVRASFAYSAGHLLETFNERKYAPSGANKSSEIYVSRTNRLKSAMNRWRAPGDITNTPRYQFNGAQYHNMYTDDKYEKGNYLAWRDLTFSYDLKNKWFDRIGLDRCRLGLQVQNLFTFTKYSGLDVTTGGAFNYPLPRTYMFNLSLGF